MGKTKRIIPHFMMDEPNDSFMFLMPINLKPDLKENIGNSCFNVVVKNITKNSLFHVPMSPEIFFTHYKFHQAYKAGKLEKQHKSKKNTFIEENDYPIEPQLAKDSYNVKLGDILEKPLIVQLLGWHYQAYLDDAKKISCYHIKLGAIHLIIPHYVIAIYYYYRSTLLREATFRCDLNNLYLSYDDNPQDASIILPHYVSDQDAPFIHRFLCQENAIEAFDSMGTFLNTYIKTVLDKNPKSEVTTIPIKAKFPYKGKFLISTRVSFFYYAGQHYHYIHEITDDTSPIGFSKFTTYYYEDTYKPDATDLDNVPTMPVDVPADTTDHLEPEDGNKKYKQRSITAKRKKKCSSLMNVEMSTDKIEREVLIAKLKIIEEIIEGEPTDQSLNASEEGKKKKIRKTRVSTKGEEFIKTTEPTDNFAEFNQYLAYMRTQNTIQNLVTNNVQAMTLVYKEDSRVNPKCMLLSKARQYITALFHYKSKYVGLLELENNAPTSTWVISSEKPFGQEIFERFLHHFVDEDMTINQMKELYSGTNGFKFKTKNHEKNLNLKDAAKTKWVVGVLSKL